MKLNKMLFVLSFLCLLAPVFAQEKTDDQALEEEFIRSRAELGESHASGARPEFGPVIIGNPTQAYRIIRVGLSFSTLNPTGAIVSEFATRHWPTADITHTAGLVRLIDRASGTSFDIEVPGTVVSVTRDDDTGYHVTIGGLDVGDFAGPLYFEPTDETNQFRIQNIRRSFTTTQIPRYRGALLLANTIQTSPDRFHVVNVIEIEDYVPGVVANESIASFHMEALKAQAIAARGYAIANIGRYIRDGFPYDIVDSSLSQVYRGVISEHARALQSSRETIGLVASYDGKIISALYSSSMGGHTENNENIFVGAPSPYLRGIYDGDGMAPDFSTEAGVRAFWMTNPVPDTYDDCERSRISSTALGNTFSRWRLTLTQTQLRARVPSSITGTITNVVITQRMSASGRAAQVRITTSTGATYTITGWEALRQFFRTAAASTPRLCGTGTVAANWVFNNPSGIDLVQDTSGNLTSVNVWGGGWGHNVGMSQYGAHGRARSGQNFVQILKAYYTGVDIGSYPIDIGREPGTGPPTLRQEFYAPNALGTLAIRPDGLKKLVVHVNDVYDIVLTEEQLLQPVVTIDISQYLVAGVNTIQYNPVGRNGSATVNVNIE
jgi:SpoIID/LytB domain protein